MSSRHACVHSLSSAVHARVTSCFLLLSPRMAELGSERTSGSVFAQEPLGIQGAWDQIQPVSLAMRGPLRTSVISSVEWALEGGSRK